MADVSRPEPHKTPQRAVARAKSSVGRSSLRRTPLRVRNPFRPRYLLRSPRAFRLLTASSGRLALAVLAISMVAGLVSSLFNHDVTTDNGIRMASSEMTAPASATSGRASFSITDGNTIRLRGGTPVRLVGFNTPEKFEPQCSREAALGNRLSSAWKSTTQNARQIASQHERELLRPRIHRSRPSGPPWRKNAVMPVFPFLSMFFMRPRSRLSNKM